MPGTPFAGSWKVMDGNQSYYLTVSPESDVSTVRVGPFDTADISADLPINNTVSIQDRFYAYLNLDEWRQ
jgi:hypothetical protein